MGEGLEGIGASVPECGKAWGWETWQAGAPVGDVWNCLGLERWQQEWRGWEKTTTEAKPSLLGGREVTPVRETQRVLVLEVGCGALAAGRNRVSQWTRPLDLRSLRLRPLSPARAKVGGKSTLQMEKPKLGGLK